MGEFDFDSRATSARHGLHLVARCIASNEKLCHAFLHGGDGLDGGIWTVIPFGSNGLGGSLRTSQMTRILSDVVFASIFCTPWVGIVVGEYTFAEWTARGTDEIVLQFFH